MLMLLATHLHLQHPAGGDGRNPFELPCAASTPAADAFGTGARVRTPLGSWSSSNAALDTVWNFTAYTIVGTSLDVNVDGQVCWPEQGVL